MRWLALLPLLAIPLTGQTSLLPVVKGPLRVAGNQLIDATGSPFTLRGTAVPKDLPLAYAGTMFSTIRQRFNMNSVRVPVNVDAALDDPAYLPRIAELVHRANRLELLVILGAEDDLPTQRTIDFWKRCAAYFRDNPHVVFDLFSEPDARWVPNHRDGVRTAAEWDFWLTGGMSANNDRLVGMQALADAVRGTGATQVILAMLFDDDLLAEGFGEPWLLRDLNTVYEVCPNNRAHSTDATRDRAFGRLARRVPVFAMDWDPQLHEDSINCHSLPRDPQAVAALIRSQMTYFDANQISWSASSFSPGKLIHSLHSMEPTEINLTPACAPNGPFNGAGLEVQLHRWSMTRENFITVGAGAGSIEIPQGGIAIGYAEVTPDPVAANEWPLPTTLGGVRIRITDAGGIERWAPLFYAGIGSVNFLIDAETAVGMAHLELVRLDGRPLMAGSVIVARVAPGFFTATMNARGPVNGQDSAGQPLSECGASGCRSVAVRVPQEVRVFGTGFRQATRIEATLGGTPIRVLRHGLRPENGYDDELVLDLPSGLRGSGEQDLIVIADDRVSNVVRLKIE